MENEIGSVGDVTDEGQGDVLHGQRMLDILAGHVQQGLHARSQHLAEYRNEGLGKTDIAIPAELFDVTAGRLPNGTFHVTIDLARANEWNEQVHNDSVHWLQQTIIDGYHSNVSFRTVTLRAPEPGIYNPAVKEKPALTPIDDGTTLRIEARTMQELNQAMDAMFPEIVAARANVIQS